MIGRVLKSSLGIAGLLAFTTMAVPTSASAQTIFDAIFGSSGSSSSWGYGSGGRRVVSFPYNYSRGTIIVSFGDRRLYHVRGKRRAVSYPIAVPRRQDRWTGTMSVSMKRVNPPWTPTPSMRRENPRLPAYVPGGHPRNPLGVRALYLGSSTYRIHGTDAPWTIGQAVSKGCIRMYNRDVIDLYRNVPVGARVIITYKRYLG